MLLGVIKVLILEISGLIAYNNSSVKHHLWSTYWEKSEVISPKVYCTKFITRLTTWSNLVDPPQIFSNSIIKCVKSFSVFQGANLFQNTTQMSWQRFLSTKMINKRTAIRCVCASTRLFLFAIQSIREWYTPLQLTSFTLLKNEWAFWV